MLRPTYNQERTVTTSGAGIHGKGFMSQAGVVPAANLIIANVSAPGQARTDKQPAVAPVDPSAHGNRPLCRKAAVTPPSSPVSGSEDGSDFVDKLLRADSGPLILVPTSPGTYEFTSALVAPPELHNSSGVLFGDALDTLGAATNLAFNGLLDPIAAAIPGVSMAQLAHLAKELGSAAPPASLAAPLPPAAAAVMPVPPTLKRINVSFDPDLPEDAGLPKRRKRPDTPRYAAADMTPVLSKWDHWSLAV